MSEITAPASASASGYLYQFTYALYRLFEGGPQRRVGIEIDDDVTEVTTSAGTVELRFTQSKLSLSPVGHPLGDRSRNLWHTLHIWLELSAKYPDDQLEFVLLTNKEVPEHALARAIGTAEEGPDIAEVLIAMRAQGAAVVGKAQPAAAAVMAMDDETLGQLVRRIKLMDDGKPDGVDDLRERTMHLFQLHQAQLFLAPQIYETLFGMLVDRTAKAWLDGCVAEFTKELFVRRLQTELLAHARKARAEQPFYSLKLQQYLSGDHSDLRFLRQIERLDFGKNIWNNALKEYWGFYAERARLRESGDLLPDDWMARNDALYQRWERLCGRYGENLQEIYHNTLEPNYHGPLGDGQSQQPYFTSGNYHALANGEEGAFPLLWHPGSEEDEE